MSFGGLLNDLCNIYNRVQSIDADTGEQLFTQELAAENVACAFQHSGGGLDRNSRLSKADNYDRLYLFPRTDITKMGTVIEVRGNKYRVREMTDLGGRKRYMRLDLERYEVNE